ncbi:MAG TPA: hypothetical protein VM687_03745 [Stenotrophomonas sp.]|nr:hypothetical protein [Stenotrophomonas sp.]
MKRKTLMVAVGAMLLVPALASANEDKFKQMDSNGDGSISSAEHAAGAQKMFTAMDTNKDGSVTAAEMDAQWAAKKGKDGKMDGKADGMKMSAAEKIKEIDTNGDGKISAAEHAAGSQKMFGKLDADGDGKVTAAEMQAGHDKAMKHASNEM